MSDLTYPRLRRLASRRVMSEGREFVRFDDPLKLVDPDLLIPFELARVLLPQCDGRTSLTEIGKRIAFRTGQEPDMEWLRSCIGLLGQVGVLETRTVLNARRSYRLQPTRPAALAGRAYSSTAATLRRELDGYHRDPRGSGLPSKATNSQAGIGVIRGVLSPHIDFRRGGPTYTWAYHALAENCQATTFIILGVAHQACRSRFILTEKDFETPLGILQTDRDRVRHLAQALGPTAFEDEIVHQDEHSIEFQTVFLQHALGHRRPIRIVPILVGSFHDLMVSNVEPCDDPEVKSLLAAFREIEASSQPGSIAYIGGIDLGHVGPQFGDVSRVHAGMRAGLREFDMGMLDLACRIDPKGWFARSARTADRWRTCGLAATYVFLHAIGPNTRGRILRYDQAVDADETCGVSFASAIFESVRAVT